MILIFSNKEDSHPTPVIETLLEWDIPYFRLNTESLLTDYTFSWTGDNSEIDFIIKNISNNKICKGSEIKAIWDRRPLKPENLPIIISEEIDKSNLEEAHEFLSYLRYYLKDLPSLGNLVNDRYASSKLLQYKIAKNIGFKFPSTILANNKKAFEPLSLHFKELAVKPIGISGFISEAEEKEYIFYSKKIPSEMIEKAPEEAFSQTVTFIQEYIPKKFELRITVVGEEIFSTKINSQLMKEGKGKEDWRQGYDWGLKWEPFELPIEIAKKCLQFLKKMRLNFGCFDFIVTPDDEYVFLECNPNGQWLWIELETGQPISETIAKWLSNPPTNFNS